MKQKTLWLLVLSTLLSSSIFAKNINLYDSPKKDSKVIATIDSEVGIIPIFSPKDNTSWIKVGDPRNGNVGWMQSSDLNTVGVNSTQFTFTQQVVGNGPHAFQVIHMNNSKQNPQSQAIFKQMEEHQKALHDQMALMIKDLSNPPPIVVPVILLSNPPAKGTPPSKASAPTVDKH